MAQNAAEGKENVSIVNAELGWSLSVTVANWFI